MSRFTPNKLEDNLRNIRNQKPKSYSLDRFDPKLKNTLKAADINKFASPFLLCSVHPYHINPNINVKDVNKELQPVLENLLEARKKTSNMIKHDFMDSISVSGYKNKKQESRDNRIQQRRNDICADIEYNNKKKTPKDPDPYVTKLKKSLPRPPSGSIETPKTKYEIAVQKMREKYPELVKEHKEIMKMKELEKRRANFGPIKNRNIEESIAFFESTIDNPQGVTDKDKEKAVIKAYVELAKLYECNNSKRTKGGKTRKYKRKRQRRKSKNTKRR
jgi:hypothetical protein